MYFVIELLASVSYLFHKIFLSSTKRIGWIFGFIGSVGFGIVTMHKGSYAYGLSEFTNTVIFLFGFFLWKRHEGGQRNITIVMTMIAMLGILGVFMLNLGSPNWILEDAMITLFSIGTILLVLKHHTGWILYILGHTLFAAYALTLHTYAIFVLQLVSIALAFAGYKRFKNDRLELKTA